jgi:uncharacterized repeat protein (TIGR01451 family)
MATALRERPDASAREPLVRANADVIPMEIVMNGSPSGRVVSRRPALVSTYVIALALAALPAAAWEAAGPFAVPTNDQCAGAEVVPGGGPFPYLTAATDLTDASTTGDPSSSTCVDLPSLSRSIWYRFVPTTTALYTISSCQDGGAGTTVVDTVIGVYTGTCGSSYSQVANGCDQDSCGSLDLQAVVRNVQLTSGTTYWIVVWKYGAAAPEPTQSTVQLLISQSLTPSNDNCNSPTVLPSSGIADGTNSLAGLDYSISSLSNLCYPGVGQSTPYSAAPGPDTVWSYWPTAPGYYSVRAQVTQGSGNLVLYTTSGNCPPAPGVFGCGTGLSVANRNALSSNWVSAEEVFCQYFASTLPIFMFVDQAETYVNATRYTIEIAPCVRETEPNDNPAAAGPLACGTGGSIGVSGDRDFFTLGAQPPGSSVFAMTDGVPAGPNNRFDLRVTTAVDTLEYDTGNNSPAFGDYSSNVAGTRLTGVGSFLRVNYNGDATAAEPYRLYAVVQPPGGGAFGTSATQESEPNNSTATANAAGTMFFSGSTTGSDPDLYRFCAMQGDVIFLSMDASPARNGVAFNPAVLLFDDHGGRLIDADYSPGGIYDFDDTAYTASTTPGTGSLTATTPYAPGEAATWRARCTGAYYAAARGSTSGSGGSNGDYLLSIAVDCETGSQQSAALWTTVTDDQDPVQPGATITYGIAMNNDGPNIALDAVLTDLLPPGTTFLSLTAEPGWTCTTPAVGAVGTVTCTTPCFPPGSASFTLQVKVGNCLPNGTEIVNTATPSSKTAGASTPGGQSTLATCDDTNPCTDDGCDPAGGCQYTNNTAPCDDGWECSTGDTCVDGWCYGVPLPFPEEVQNVQVSRIGTIVTISWSSGTGASWYDVLRGRTATLPVGSAPESEMCIVNDVAGTTTQDPEPPVPGIGSWYLVRGESACGIGTCGFQSYRGAPAMERNGTACP